MGDLVITIHSCRQVPSVSTEAFQLSLLLTSLINYLIKHLNIFWVELYQDKYQAPIEVSLMFWLLVLN